MEVDEGLDQHETNTITDDAGIWQLKGTATLMVTMFSMKDLKKP